MIKQSTWNPRPGWLMLVPSTLPDKTEHGVILPESFTEKSQSGIVVKTGQSIDNELFLHKEVFFPKHQEYQLFDSDNQQKYFILNAEHVIMIRTPPKQESKFKVIVGEEAGAIV